MIKNLGTISSRLIAPRHASAIAIASNTAPISTRSLRLRPQTAQDLVVSPVEQRKLYVRGWQSYSRGLTLKITGVQKKEKMAIVLKCTYIHQMCTIIV